MPDAAQIHRRTEARLNEVARRHFPAGTHHVTWAQVAALGRGDLQAGEDLLQRMFRTVGPRSLHPAAVRDAGNGSMTAGRKVLQRFFARADKQLGLAPSKSFADGGQVDDAEFADQPVPKAGQTIPPVNARPMTGQAAMSALGIPDISTMTPEEQMMFAAGSLPMIAGGPEAKIAEEAAPEIAQAVRQGIRAYHGSPYDFERFDLSRIGSGQGAQSFGRGLYFAQNPQVAETYKLGELADAKVGGETYDYNNPIHAAAALISDHGDRNEAAYQVMHTTGYQNPNSPNHKWMRDVVDVLYSNKDIPPYTTSKAKMYEVSINADPEHFLDWDKPLSEQHPKVQEALQVLAQVQEGEDRFNHDPRLTGEGFLASGPSKGRSAELLREAGIPGIRYLDQGSRGRNEYFVAAPASRGDYFQVMGPGNISHGKFPSRAAATEFADSKNAEGQTHNFVIFDDSLISILKKYGLAGLVAGNAFHFQWPADQGSEPEPEQHSRGGRTMYRYERVPIRGYARGGSVKLTKAEAHYRDSAEDNRFCARCAMYRDENKCTLVAGPVHRVGLCDYYEKAR